jgi:hypothetical protein
MLCLSFLREYIDIASVVADNTHVTGSPSPEPRIMVEKNGSNLFQSFCGNANTTIAHSISMVRVLLLSFVERPLR